MNNFSFGTKAETLEALEDILRHSTIPDFFHFTVEQWNANPAQIISQVVERFGNTVVIVRSSAQGEDREDCAMAGAYESIPGVIPVETDNLQKSIEQVITSYKLKKDTKEENQVIVQEMVSEVSMSGVLFTRDMNTGAPYYVINYDDETGRTDTVSSGTGYCNRTLLIHQAHWKQLTSPRFLKLIKAIQEIEEITQNQLLDVEFALDIDNAVHILQVRRITTKANWNEDTPNNLNDILNQIGTTFKQKLSPISGVIGSRSILGRMPDWNPSEMIGCCPRPLALSLYRHLITDSTWRKARALMGYADPKGMPLMLSLGGQPFIDVRLSFHSFLPGDLDTNIGHKLVDCWLDRLEEKPHLHDKVEFDVAQTIQAFDFNDIMDRRYPKVLSNDERNHFSDCLNRLTRHLITGEVCGIDQQLALVERLNQLRPDNLSNGNGGLVQIITLLEECIEYGTTPFSILARHGFIAISLLRSLIHTNVLTLNEVRHFQRSVPTVAGEMVEDMEEVRSGAMSREEFMREYGHLRPGTYEILSSRYDQRGELFSGMGLSAESKAKIEPFVLSPKQSQDIAKHLKAFSYPLSPDELMTYMASAIQARESAKFVFSRNISDALELITTWGEHHGLSRNDLSHLNIQRILDCLTVTEAQSQESRLHEIAQQKMKDYETTLALRLPQLISKPSDLFIVPLPVDQPNYVTSKTVQTETIYLDGSVIDPVILDGKIVLIEGADPGYDWIFSHPIKGLITKFGGANSHMTIRCAEFGLPAAIGCGEQIFDRVLKARGIMLNCAEQRIIPLC